ncbi:MAG: DUF1583 domain-containing protein [Fuerstiella sp.]
MTILKPIRPALLRNHCFRTLGQMLVSVQGILLTLLETPLVAPVAASLLLSVAFGPNAGAEPPADLRRATGAIFADGHIAESALQIHKRAVMMPPEKRLEFLTRWVLPTDDHATVRLQVAFTPTHPISGSVDGTDAGGQLVSPAIDLVRTAAELNRLTPLLQQVTQVPATNRLSLKKSLALQAMILLQQGQQDEGLAVAERFTELCLDPVPNSADHRSAEAVLFVFSRHQPGVQEVLRDTVDRIVQETRRANSWDLFTRRFKTLSTRSHRRSDDDAKASLKNFSQWQSVSTLTAASRGSGIPESQWLLRPGQADNLVSHGDDYLYFQSPLRGRFQVECDFTSFSWTDTELMVGGTWVSPVYTHEAYDVGDVRNNYRRLPLSPRLSKIRDRFHYRTVVAPLVQTQEADPTKRALLPEESRSDVFSATNAVIDQETRSTAPLSAPLFQATTFVNGRPLHVHPLQPHHDPWVAIRNDYKNEGSAFNVRVTGNPVIPEQILMAADERLGGWLPYFGGSVGWSDSAWQGLYRGDREAEVSPEVRLGGGLFGVRRPDLAGTHCEQAIFYHRPILEDGTIEYEFYYREGQLTAHPAIDRLCLLMTKQGVRVHWLTDGAFDRTGISPDNQTDEPENRRGPSQLPLRPDAWNRVTVSLTGNRLSLMLNRELVYERDLDPHNQRRFGIFHFADRSEVRVRNMVWSGDWPRELPLVTAQPLATDEALFLEQNTQHLTEQFHYDFTDSAAEDSFRESFSVIRGSAADHLQFGSAGLLTRRPGAVGYHNTTIAPAAEIHGDFDVTVAYSQFQAETIVDGNNSVMLIVGLQNETADEFFVSRRQVHRAKDVIEQCIQCALVRRPPEGEKREYFGTTPSEQTAGRLRLARRGDQIFFLSAEGDSENFRLLASRECATDPVALNGLRLVNQMHQPGFSSVTWKSVTVRAEKLSGLAIDAADARLTRLNEQRSRLAVNVVHDFTKQPPDPNQLQRWGEVSPWNANDDGLLIAATGQDAWTSSGVGTLHPISGDFDIRVDFDLLNLATPPSGAQTYLLVQVDTMDAVQSQLRVFCARTETGQLRAVSQLRRTQTDGSVDYQLKGALDGAAVTALRVARRGQRVTAVVKPIDSEQERILSVTDVNDQPISVVRVLLHTGGPERYSTVRLKTFEIAADNYQQPLAQPPPLKNVIDLLLEALK